MVHWCDLWWNLRGGPHHHRDAIFYAWCTQQTVVVDEYALQYMDFHEDPDLALPPRAQWGEIGIFFVFYVIIFSYFFPKGSNLFV